MNKKRWVECDKIRGSNGTQGGLTAGLLLYVTLYDERCWWEVNRLPLSCTTQHAERAFGIQKLISMWREVFFFFFSAPIYRDIVGFYWAPFIKISLKTFLEIKTPPLYTYMLCIWKMHFNHWWVNKVLWWRPNMVIVKIKKKTIWSGTATFIMHHRTLFILFWLDCVLTKNEEKLVLKKNSICWNHPYKHRYICYKYSSPPRETIGQRNWFCSVFSAHRS